MLEVTAMLLYLFEISGFAGSICSLCECAFCLQRTGRHGCRGTLSRRVQHPLLHYLLFPFPSFPPPFPPSILPLTFLPSLSPSLLSSFLPLSLSPSKVCIHISRCYRVSAQFEACREAITEIPNIVKDTCRVLYYKVCDIQWLHHDDITGTMMS